MKVDATSAPARRRALLQLLRTADVLWNTSHALFVRWDVSPSQFNVLNVLGMNPAGLTQTDLSRELVMHRSNVTGLVDRLEQRGLVQRHEVASDRRAYRVVLTRAGERLLGEILPLYERGAVAIMEHLSADRAAALADDLAAIAARAGAVAEQLEIKQT